MLFTALALAKILAFSEPQVPTWNHAPKERSIVERLADLDVGDQIGKPWEAMLPGMVPVIISNAGFVKNIQQGSITIGTSATSNTLTITSVVTGNTKIVFNGLIASNTGTEDATTDMATVTLTNSTTVTANRNTGSATLTVEVRFTVVEYYPNIVTVQYVSVSITTTNTSNTGSISAVTTSRSVLHWLGSYSNNTGVLRGLSWTYATISSTTQVTVNRNGSTSSTCVTSLCVVEYASGVLQSSTQAFAFNETTNDTSNITISSVTTGNSMIAYAGQTGLYSSSMNSAYLAQAWLAGATTVSYQRDTSGSGQININGTVYEYKSSDVSQSVQRGNTTPVTDGSTSTDITITSLTSTARAYISYIGQYATAGSGAAASMNEVSVKIQSAIAVRVEHGADSGTPTQAPSWEVIVLRGA